MYVLYANCIDTYNGRLEYHLNTMLNNEQSLVPDIFTISGIWDEKT